MPVLRRAASDGVAALLCNPLSILAWEKIMSPNATTPQVEIGQLWQRKRDGVLIAVRELTGSSHSFTRVQNLQTGRHFEVTASGIRTKYEFAGYDRPTQAKEIDHG